MDGDPTLVGGDAIPGNATPAEMAGYRNDVAIVGLVLQQLRDLESRLGMKLDQNASDGRQRWAKHELDHEEQVQAINHLKMRLDSHLADEEREDLIMQARLGPVKRTGAWMIREWRTIVILALLSVDFIGTVLDYIRKATGG